MKECITNHDAVKVQFLLIVIDRLAIAKAKALFSSTKEFFGNPPLIVAFNLLFRRDAFVTHDVNDLIGIIFTFSLVCSNKARNEVVEKVVAHPSPPSWNRTCPIKAYGSR